MLVAERASERVAETMDALCFGSVFLLFFFSVSLFPTLLLADVGEGSAALMPRACWLSFARRSERKKEEKFFVS